MRERQERKIQRSSAESRSRRIGLVLVFFVIAMLSLLFMASRGWPDTVAGIDLSLSEKKASITGRSRLESYKISVARIIRTLTVSERISILALSGKSRADPWIIFSARMGEKEGFFGERLRRDRALIAAAWRRRSGKLKLFSKKTDILGFFDLAAQLLARSRKKTIYVFSDGMNCTNELNLEAPPEKAELYLRRLNRLAHFPALNGVSVHWFGAGGPSASSVHFRALELFWKGFVERSGGRIEQFTSFTEVR